MNIEIPNWLLQGAVNVGTFVFGVLFKMVIDQLRATPAVTERGFVDLINSLQERVDSLHHDLEKAEQRADAFRLLLDQERDARERERIEYERRLAEMEHTIEILQARLWRVETGYDPKKQDPRN